jgi:hypothetical protein
MPKDSEKDSLHAHVLADRRYAAMLGLGFSAGIPYLLARHPDSAATPSCRPAPDCPRLGKRNAHDETVILAAIAVVTAERHIKRAPEYR